MELEDGITAKKLKSALSEAKRQISELQIKNHELYLENSRIKKVNEELHITHNQDKATIDELINVNNDLDNLIKSTEIATIFLDKNLHIRKITPQAQKQFQLTQEDLGKSILSFEQLSKGFTTEFLYEVISSKNTKEDEIKTGDKKWFLRRTCPFLKSSEEVEGLLISYIDIHKLKQSENKYQYQNQAFEQVLEGTMAGYFDWLLPTNEEYLSPTFKKMFGYEDHEMENKPESWQRIIHPDDLPKGMKAFDAHVQSKGQVPFDSELRYFHKDGSIIWVFCRAKVIEWGENDEPIRVVGSHVDITPLKKYSEELERINHELDQFAYIASHDLQEPLRNVTNYINLILEDHVDELGEKPEKYINLISNSAERMKKLIKGFLKFSRVGRELNFQIVDCNQIVKDVLDDMTLLIQESDVKIDFDPLPQINGLRVELRQLFHNLIGNAIKFRNPHEQLQITIKCQLIGDNYQFSISDNGIGMEKVNTDKIFQIFQRMHTNSSYEGQGIGLAICKKVVDLHKGKIWAESQLGLGSTFFFTISNSL